MSEQCTAPQARPGTILVVDDDDSVRALVKIVLQQHGYCVLAAGSGEEAVGIAEAHPGGIDLLVTDYTMPAMTGDVLANRLQARWPGLRVIYLTGGMVPPALARNASQGAAEVMHKPFLPRELAAKVTEALARAG